MSVNGAGFDYLRHKLRTMLWILLGRRQAACEELDLILRRWPRDAYALASRAHLREQLGQRDGAIDDARALVATHPRRSAADWFNLAYLLEASGQWVESEPAFREAVALDPNLDRAWYGLGLVLIRLQRLDEAVDALMRNTELQPMSPYGWYQLARVQVERQQPDEARLIITRLKNFEPKVAAQLERETGLKG